MGHSFSSLDELGDGPGFRKVRRGLGVTAFGVNAIVFPPGYEGFLHFHDEQEKRELGPGGLVHVESTTPRRVSNASATDDLVVLVIGGKGGYVERDGHLVDAADAARRASFGA